MQSYGPAEAQTALLLSAAAKKAAKGLESAAKALDGSDGDGGTT